MRALQHAGPAAVAAPLQPYQDSPCNHYADSKRSVDGFHQPSTARRSIRS